MKATVTMTLTTAMADKLIPFFNIQKEICLGGVEILEGDLRKYTINVEGEKAALLKEFVLLAMFINVKTTDN